ncbi:MAG: hypothetical protein A2W19_09300 [Spirochaetes bacterium RBG_16_49_21]|nr:MAG: hypothetical protein A2W19_09300 [Spirochaetes bacterium RBG_16_49_21]
MKKIIAGVLAFSVIVTIFVAVANGGTKYSIFCANGKIEVEMRSLEKMKSARGSDVCLIKEFDYSSDAENEAGKLGGKGASCKCN